MAFGKEGRPEVQPQLENVESNFNNKVWIKVTPEGERIRDEYYKGFNLKAPPLEKDEARWTAMRLHEVARVFGSEMYNGNNSLPIETTFRIENPSK